MKKNKIFIACDSKDIGKIKEIIRKTENSKLKIGYKFGLEFLNSKDGRKFISKLKNKITFGDYKFLDIPNTCVSAIKAVKDLNFNYLTIHINSGLKALKLAKKASGKTKLIGVTVLTSLDNKSLKVIIYPTPVQGKLAPNGIADALKIANQRNEVDVLIVCRGGGSIEDLWSFNDELVAREIFSSQLPIISAIGHQTDFTISDFVADLRAPTPTAAAEIISTSYEELLGSLDYYKSNLLNIIQNKIDQLIQRIDFLEKGLVSPIQKIVLQFDLVLALKNRMEVSMSFLLEKYQEQIKSYKQNLAHLNPNEILSRGYSIILNQNKKIINNASTMNVSDKIKIKFHKGLAEASITKINQNEDS